MKKILAIQLTNGCLASPPYFIDQDILSSAPLAVMGSTGVECLSACGCLCSLDSNADVSCSPDSHTDAYGQLVSALSAAAKRQGLPLKRPVSERQLGTEMFEQVCQILANVDINTLQDRQLFWQLVEQCSIWQLVDGTPVSLASNKRCIMLPYVEWEQRVAHMTHHFPWVIIKHHSGSALQKKLWKNLMHCRGSGLVYYNTVPFFLKEALLPAMYRSKNAALQHLLLNALDDMGL